MQTKVIWENEFGTNLALVNDQGEHLKDICDVMDLFVYHDVIFEISHDAYTDEFLKFLWDNKTLKSKCGDDLVLLQKRICKAKEIDKNEYDNKVNIVIQKKRDDSLLMLISDRQDNELCIENENGYYNARDYQMKHLVYEDEFYDLAKISYRNLYFSDSVKDSIRSLKNEFEQIRKMIGEHLSALDREYELFLSAQKRGYVELAKLFEKSEAIECSTQAGREGIKALKFDFVDKDGANQTITCELHTKLKYKGMNYKNQDRIYFHPPIKDIEDGKILIAYIGRHL